MTNHHTFTPYSSNQPHTPTHSTPAPAINHEYHNSISIIWMNIIELRKSLEINNHWRLQSIDVRKKLQNIDIKNEIAKCKH